MFSTTFDKNALESITENFLFKLACSVLIICFTIRWMQSSPLTFHCNNKHKVLLEFLDKSNIRNMIYRPHFLCLYHIGQSLIYIICQNIYLFRDPTPFENELFLMPDGGTIGVSWCVHNGIGKPKRGKEPILLMAPGLGGSIYNMYIMTLLTYAKTRGFKIGVIRFRNANGVPVTSNKLNYSGSYEEVRVAVDYVYNKYV